MVILSERIRNTITANTKTRIGTFHDLLRNLLQDLASKAGRSKISIEIRHRQHHPVGIIRLVGYIISHHGTNHVYGFLSSPVSDSVHSLGQSAPLVSDAGNHRSSLVGDVLQLGYTLERDQTAVPVIDSTTKYDRADSKLLRREKEKKIALGHKADDHEEEQTHTWQQTM